MFKLKILPYFIISLASCSVWGFHDKGVADCSACHIIHNSENGTIVDPNSPDGNLYILKAESPSDLCFSCHATQNGAVFGVDPLNPPPEKGAGNFVFLLEDNINDQGNSVLVIDGNSAGHNLNAPSHGLNSDPNKTVAPGGTYASSMMSCTSCHDPHGNDSFRMLHSAGPIQNNTYTFLFNAPIAEGIDLATNESRTNHTAYQSGISEWCANCHGTSYHDNESAGPTFDHPAPTNFESNFVTRYNVYNGSTDPSGGTALTAYIPEVPFEDIANTTTSTQGPTTASKVACITCHRAHATSSPGAGRWDFNVQLLENDGANSGSYPIPNPYPDPSQERLCVKCHTNFGGGGNSGAVTPLN